MRPSWPCGRAVGSGKDPLSASPSLCHVHTAPSSGRSLASDPPSPSCWVAGRMEWGDLWRAQPQEWHPGMLGRWPREPTLMGSDQAGQAGAAGTLGERWPCPPLSKSFHPAGWLQEGGCPGVCRCHSKLLSPGPAMQSSYWMATQWDMETIIFVTQEWVSLACWVGDNHMWIFPSPTS